MTEIDIVEAEYGSAGEARHAAAALYLGTVITADISEAVASYLFFLFSFFFPFLLCFLSIVNGLCSAQNHLVLFMIPLDMISFFLSFCLFSFTPLYLSSVSLVWFFCRILIFRSASYQVQWNWYWLLIRITQSDFSSLFCRPELPACRSVTI